MVRKTCRICGVSKPLTEFHRASGARDGHRGECRECFRELGRSRYIANREKYIAASKAWQQANPDRHNAYQRERNKQPEVKRRQRDAYYQRTYGISAEDVDAMLQAQGGGCAICGRLPERLASLHVDHDHEHGNLRGLLCLSCNHGLGQFRDDPALLGAAADYLIRTRPT